MSRKFLVYWKQRNHDDIFTEEVEVPDGYDSDKYIASIYDSWNKTEDERSKLTVDDLNTIVRESMTEEERKNWKYPVSYRDLILIYDLNETAEEKPVVEYCNSRKVNLVSLKSSGGDVYQCGKCGRYRLRVGFGDFTEGVCNPELLCTTCQRVFTTQEEYKAHFKERPHKKPKWLKEIGR